MLALFPMIATLAADGPATGTIVIKYAPQSSWEKVYAATNKAAYRSNHVQASGHFLYVDDTTTQYATVLGYEDMSGVSTGTGPFPSTTQMPAGGRWYKSAASSGSAANRWQMFSDERFLITAISTNYYTNPSHTQGGVRCFGDLQPFAPAGDVWSSVLSCAGTTISTYNGGLEHLVHSSATAVAGGAFSPRGYAGLGSAVQVTPTCFVGGASTSGNDSDLGDGPSVVDGRIYTSTLYYKESGPTSPPRAQVPGFRYVPQRVPSGMFSSGDLVAGTGDLAGHTLWASLASNTYNNTPSGVAFVDLTGPWR